MNIYIDTYGCAANQNDSEIMAGLLSRAGFDIVTNIDIADLIILNTCVVKLTTENKIRYKIKQLEKMDKKLIIAGCMPASEYRILRELTNASLIGPNAVTSIVSVVKETLKDKIVEEFEGQEKICQPKIKQNKIIDIVQIAEGCISNCSFCITKKARGSLHSYMPEKIVKEISMAKKNGCKEFWLTSQDCGCYGFDKKTNLSRLLEKITTEIPGKYFIRVGMMNPQHIQKYLDHLMEVYKHENIYKFLHLPIQSGSNEILRKMNRNYTIEECLEIIQKMRKNVPKITIWTDVIVGFPGETEDDFQCTVEALEEIQPDFTNVSRYCSRPGTKAKSMEQHTTEIKKKRSREVSKLVNRISIEKNREWIGWEGSSLIDEFNQKNNNWIARNQFYKPITVNGNYRFGQWINIHVKNARKTCLKGNHRG